jgi:hypothetical protein
MKGLFLLVSLLVCGASCNSVPVEKKIPGKDVYSYYSGSGELANYYCKVQHFNHPESGKTVTLIGMIHTADDSFYREVDQQLDQADIILTEGIYGLPSFGPFKYFSTYTFSIIDRFTYLQGLMPQGESLKERQNTISADMSSAEFSSQGHFYTPVIQLVSLPIMMVFTEPYYLYSKSKVSLASLFSENWGKRERAKIRHLTLKNIDTTDKPVEAFLPGIIGARNKALLAKLAEQVKVKSTKSIAIPWGAAHMPSLERDMLALGYTKTESRWLRSIAVKDYLNSSEIFPETASSWGVPYLYSFGVSQKSFQSSALFSMVKYYESKNFNRFSLIYGDIFEKISFKEGQYISVLPRLFGKPLFFDFTSKKEKKRLRLFWFLEFGSLE